MSRPLTPLLMALFVAQSARMICSCFLGQTVQTNCTAELPRNALGVWNNFSNLAMIDLSNNGIKV